MGVVRQFRRIEAAEPSNAVKPPLKWAGGERWQLSELLPYWQANSHRRLVEPFCGGLGVVTGLVPHKALLNDVNPHVINLYQQLKTRFETQQIPLDRVQLAVDERLRYEELMKIVDVCTKQVLPDGKNLQRISFIEMKAPAGK